MSRTGLLAALVSISGFAAAFGQQPQPLPPAHLPPPPPRADAPAGPSPTLKDDLHEVRLLIEQQGKQLDALAREVAQLSQQIQELHGASTTASSHDAQGASNNNDSHPQEPAAGSTSPVSGETATAPADAAAESPKAEAVTSPGGGLKHTVTKGETFTSIAKHYNIAVTDLQKANKTVDERKLQIGQVLNIPPVKAPENHTAPSKEKH